MTTSEAAPATSIEQDPPTPGMAPPATTTPDSPGQALRHARASRNLDINYVATALRLSPQVVESIERDDYSSLPSAVFVSGYIRSYARLMEIDPEPLNRRFRDLHPAAEAPPRHFARPEQDLKGRDGSNPALYLISVLIVLALAAAAYVWWSNRPHSEPTADAPPSSEPASPTDTAAVIDGAPAVDDAAPLPQPEPPPATPDPGAQPSTEAVLAPASADGPAPESQPSQTSDATAASETESATQPTAEAARTPAQALTAEPTSDSVVDETSATAPAEDTAVSAPDQAIEDPDQTETGPSEDQPAPASGPDRVDLAFTGPCWVDIRDAKGTVLLFGEMARGDQETLAGDPPYSLVIGNAAAVEMTVGGTPYDVRAVARGNVARFEIDPRDLDSSSGTSAAETTDTD